MDNNLSLSYDIIQTKRGITSLSLNNSTVKLLMDSISLELTLTHVSAKCKSVITLYPGVSYHNI